MSSDVNYEYLKDLKVLGERFSGETFICAFATMTFITPIFIFVFKDNICKINDIILFKQERSSFERIDFTKNIHPNDIVLELVSSAATIRPDKKSN